MPGHNLPEVISIDSDDDLEVEHYSKPLGTFDILSDALIGSSH